MSSIFQLNTYRITAYDILEHVNTSRVFIYTTDTTQPTVFLINPTDGTTDTDGSITFEYIPSNLKLSNCSLYLNSTGVWKRNQTDTTLSSGNINTFTQTLPNGTYLWNVYCMDKAGLSKWGSSNYTVSVADTTRPQIDFITPTPTNNTFVSDNWAYINASVTESFEDTFILSWNQTNYTYTNKTHYQNFSSLADGNYTYYAWVNDTSGNGNVTGTRKVIIDTTYPQVDFSTGTPVNQANASRNWIYFDVSITEINFANITFMLYNSTDSINQTFFDTANKTLSANFTTTNTNEQYQYNVSIYDKAGNLNKTGTRNLTLDTAYPQITALSPKNNTQFINENVTFVYNVSDTRQTANCSLVLNDAINTTNTSITENTNMTFANLTLPGRNYTWSIRCFDEAGNSNSSLERKISVIVQTDFTGDTTNLTAVNTSNITYLVLENPQAGKINFSQTIDLGEGADLNAYVNVSSNRIEVDSTNLPALDKAAVLSFYNLTFTDPRPLRDGSACPGSICTEISYSNGAYVFSVSQFTVYSAGETPVATTTTTPPGGGGGGGGGEAIVPKTTTTTLPPGVIKEFSTSKERIKTDLVVEKAKTDEITITNTGNEGLSFTLSIIGVEEQVFLSDYNFTLQPGTARTITLNMMAGEKPGIYTGHLLIRADGLEKKIPIVIEVHSEIILFDAKIDLPREYKEVFPGDTLKAQITLFNIIGKEVDVTINYLIKDMNGNTIMTESETVVIETQATFTKDIRIPDNLKMGTYVFASKAKYADSVGTSSYIFDVVEEERETMLYTVLYGLGIVIIILFGLTIFLAYKKFYSKRSKIEKVSESRERLNIRVKKIEEEIKEG